VSLWENCAFTVSREQKLKHKAFLCSEYSATENMTGSVSVIRQQSRTETFNVTAGKVRVYLSGKKNQSTNQNTFYTAPYVTSESEPHDDEN